MIRDLALIVAAAALVTLIFHRLRLPVVLGYLLTGLALSPFLTEFPVLHGRDGIEQLNSLGMLFLIFTIGLFFDLTRLRGVFWPALIAGTLQMAVVFFLGVVFAPLVGFGPGEGVLLGAVLTTSGGILCVSLLRAKGRLHFTDAHLAIGVLMVESVVAVVFLVFLSGYAIAGSFTLHTVLRALFLIAVFIVGVYLLGRIVAPWLAAFLRRARNPELVTLVAVALVLGLSELARLSEVSQALGAFVAGAVLARTVLQREIQRVTEPFRDLFCALFFVSIAMLVDLNWLIGFWPELVLIVVLVVAVKAVTCWLGMFVGGQPAEVSLRASLSKASVGEFGFVIAGLGYKLGLVSDRLLSLSVGLAVGSYILVLLLNARPERLYGFFAQRTPDSLSRAARIYERMLDAMGRYIGRRTFLMLGRDHLLKAVLCVVLLVLLIAGAYLGSGWVVRNPAIDRSGYWLLVGLWLVVAAVSVPVLTAVLRHLDALVAIITDATLRYGTERQLLTSRMRTLFHTVLQCVVLVLFGGCFLAAASPFFPSGSTLVVFLGLFALVSLLFWRSINALNSRIEYLFYQSFQAHSRQDDEAMREGVLKELAQKYPWDAKVVEHVMDAKSVACGRRIADLRIRKQTGATIIAVRRGGWTQFSPSLEQPLFPGDTVVLFGSQAQTQEAVRMLSVAGPEPKREFAGSGGFVVDKVFVGGFAPLVGRTLFEAEVQEVFGVSVLGIQRGGVRITPVATDELIHSGDLLLVAGQAEAIHAFSSACSGGEDAEAPVWQENTDNAETEPAGDK